MMRIARIAYVVVVSVYFLLCSIIGLAVYAGGYSGGSVLLAGAMALTTLPGGLAGLVVGFEASVISRVVRGGTSLAFYAAIVLIGIRLFRKQQLSSARPET